MYTLYQFAESGNCYKIRLLFANLGIPLETTQIDITRGESRSGDYLKINPVGQVPVLKLPDGRYLPESHAILWHIAFGTDLLPNDPWVQTQIIRWLSFEQYKLEPKIGVARFLLKSMGKKPEEIADRLPELKEGAAFALSILDRELADKEFLLGDNYSIADIGLYGYSHVAEEGDISLAPYKNLHRWFKNIEQQPGYIAITR